MTLQQTLEDLASRGRAVRPSTTGIVSVDDVLFGISRDGGLYALKVLLGGYLDAQSRVGFAEGDKVRVRRRYVESLNRDGWKGYSAMFHDATATVLRVQYSPHHSKWYVDVEYPTPYYYAQHWGSNPEPRYELYVKDRPSVFMMWPEHLKLVRRAK